MMLVVSRTEDGVDTVICEYKIEFDCKAAREKRSRAI